MLCQGLKRDDLPYGSVGPADIAQGIAFLASDAAKTISGITMPIDNAWSTIKVAGPVLEKLGADGVAKRFIRRLNQCRKHGDFLINLKLP